VRLTPKTSAKFLCFLAPQCFEEFVELQYLRALTQTEADALVTKTPGILLGVLAADCAPVLFSDAKNGVVAAAHAGWKGALGG